MSIERARPIADHPIRIAGPADIATWQAKLRAVVLDVVTEDEIRDVMKAVLARAKAGDLAAARMILAYAIGNPPKRDPEPGDAATRARPGSRAKVEALAYRHANGVDLHHPRDAAFSEED